MRPAASPRLAVPVVPWWLVYLIGFIPAAWCIFAALTGRAGADPVAWLEHELGQWALRFLIATLCVTPLRQIAGVNLLRYRRALGLLGFWYVALHLGSWLVFDLGGHVTQIIRDIFRRPYITIGMIAFLLLIPLAVTSNAWSIRRLGGRNWALLHRLAYVATALGAVHFIMVKKVWLVEPLIYAGIIAALLIWRIARATQRRIAGRRRPLSGVG